MTKKRRSLSVYSQKIFSSICIAAISLITISPACSETLSLESTDPTELFSQAKEHFKQGKYSEAERKYKLLHENFDELYGAEARAELLPYILSLIGTCLQRQGKFADAMSYTEKALKMHENLYGANDYRMYDMILSSADVALSLGRYTYAEELFIRSLELINKAPASKPRREITMAKASIYSYLGVLYGQTHRLSKSEDYLLKAFEILRKFTDPNLPHAKGSTLAYLSRTAKVQGKFALALEYALHSLSFMEKAYGTKHPHVAWALTEIGSIYARVEEYKSAESFIREALSIHESFPDSSHDSLYAKQLLAQTLIAKRQYREAESILTTAINDSRKTYGPQDRYAAEIEHDLAWLYVIQNDLDKALHMSNKTISMLEKWHDENQVSLLSHSRYNSLRGYILAEKKDWPNALRHMKESLAYQYRWLTEELSLQSTHTRNLQHNAVDKIQEIAFKWLSSTPESKELAFWIRLNWHGLLQDIESRQHQLASSSSTYRALLERLTLLDSQISSITIKPDTKKILAEEKNKIQKQLYRSIPGLQIRPVDKDQIASLLPKDGVLIEYQRYRHYTPSVIESERWSNPTYVAFVLRPNGSLSAVDLGPAEIIDSLVAKALNGAAENHSDATQSFSDLSAKIINPLLAELRDAEQWFISPDSELNKVPFAALPMQKNTNRTLAKSIKLRMLTTGRDLIKVLDQTSYPDHRKNRSVVFSDPDFGLTPTKQHKHLRNKSRGDGSTYTNQGSLRDKNWPSLAGTRVEGSLVSKLLNASHLEGEDVTEDAFYNLDKPTILHAATHGFFFSERDNVNNRSASTESSAPKVNHDTIGSQLLSGIVIAGANSQANDSENDGYLTAAEILNLNLNGTSLVTLSACSTALGGWRSNQDLYSLQRSLSVAGAKSTLLSLWKVDDQATTEFMIRFYTRLKQGESRSDALANVQEEFRTGKVKSPSGIDWSEPYYWAAWQLTGDWRPIQGL